MASFEISGTLKVKSDTQVISEKFSKRDFVITIDEETQYPQYISLQLVQDKCSQLDNYNVGDQMKVSFNLRGREWSGPQGIKYFNSLEAWRIEKVSATNGPSSSPSVSYMAPESTSNVGHMAPGVITAAPSNDDLPF